MKYKYYLKLLTSITVCCLFISGTVFASSYDDLQKDADEAKTTQSNLSQKKDAANAAANKEQNDLNKLVQQLASTEAEITSTNKEIVTTEANIQTTEVNIETKQAEIQKTEAEIKEFDENIKKSMVAMQESSTNDMLAFLFQAENLTDLINRYESMDTIYSYTDENIKKRETLVTSLESQKKALETEKKNLETQKKNLENQKSSLVSLKATYTKQKTETANKLEGLKELAKSITEDVDQAKEDTSKKQETLKFYASLGCKPGDVIGKDCAVPPPPKKTSPSTSSNGGSNTGGSTGTRQPSGSGSGSSGGGSSSSSGFRLPTAVGSITCGFHCYAANGHLHEGADIGLSVGNPVYASASGVVYEVTSGCRVGNSWCGEGFGNVVSIVHNIGGKTYTTRYAHLSSVSAYPGQHVTSNTMIGLSGNTGNSTGPHLHFVIALGQFRIDYGYGAYFSTYAQDPTTYIKFPGYWTSR